MHSPSPQTVSEGIFLFLFFMNYLNSLVYGYLKSLKENFSKNSLIDIYQSKYYPPAFFFVVDDKTSTKESDLFWYNVVSRLEDFNGTCIESSFATENRWKNLDKRDNRWVKFEFQ